MNRLVDYDAVLLSLTAFVRLPLGKKHASQRDKSSDDPPRNKLDGVSHVDRRLHGEKEFSSSLIRGRLLQGYGSDGSPILVGGIWTGTPCLRRREAAF